MARGVAAPRSIALTYDDGPNPDGTRRVLDLLAWRGVQATFFVWGEAAERHPEVVREVVAAGHSVQPHCFRHISHWERGRDEIAADTMIDYHRRLAAGADSASALAAATADRIAPFVCFGSTWKTSKVAGPPGFGRVSGSRVP